MRPCSLWNTNFLLLWTCLLVAPSAGKPPPEARYFTDDSGYLKLVEECPTFPSRPPPTSVKDLRPQDIKVVMALGDSITAGFSMKASNILQTLTKGIEEDRGCAASIGGDKGAATLPNFLSHFSGGVVGASLGVSLPLDAVIFRNHSITPNNPRICHLNGAQSNAQAQHMESQVDYLVKAAKLEPDLDMETDWKVLSIMIGANNACPAEACSDEPPEWASPVDVGRAINSTVAKVRSEFPRVFVNLVSMPGISQTYYHRKYKTCEMVWRVLDECPCNWQTDSTRENVDRLIGLYNDKLEDIAGWWGQQGLEDFAVVVQPFAKGSEFPQPPEKYVSHLDCFHPSLSTNELMAVGLWNNMISKRADKETGLSPDTLKPKCPDENTLLWTD